MTVDLMVDVDGGDVASEGGRRVLVVGWCEVVSGITGFGNSVGWWVVSGFGKGMCSKRERDDEVGREWSEIEMERHGGFLGRGMKG